MRRMQEPRPREFAREHRDALVLVKSRVVVDDAGA